MVDAVRIESCYPIGLLILSQPSTLNALTLDMLRTLHEGLRTLEADASIKLIVIKSDSERAFCAGGDMKHIRQLCIDHDFDAVDDYFNNEYALNLAISQCNKPYLALIDGVAMGGGLGLSIHGRFRVVTDKAVLAMPESRIGFFPDVGASWFLPRLPQRCGYWMALTSASVTGTQAVQVGLATHYIPEAAVDSLVDELGSALQDEQTGPFNAVTTIERCLSLHSIDIDPGDPSQASFSRILAQRETWFTDDEPENIERRLQNAAEHDIDAERLLALLQGASPYSLVTTIDLFRRAAGQPLASCLQLEFATAQEACRHPDLVEGVRAVLVDKDRNPAWADTVPDTDPDASG